MPLTIRFPRTARQIAEGYGLGRIEAVELWHVLDRRLRRTVRPGPPPPAAPPARRWAVISADTNAE